MSDAQPPRELVEYLALVDEQIAALTAEFVQMGLSRAEAHRQASRIHAAPRQWATDALASWSVKHPAAGGYRPEGSGGQAPARVPNQPSAVSPGPRPERAREAAEAGFWCLAFALQAHMFHAPRFPFDMAAFAPEARAFCNAAEQRLYDACAAIAGVRHG